MRNRSLALAFTLTTFATAAMLVAPACSSSSTTSDGSGDTGGSSSEGPTGPGVGGSFGVGAGGAHATGGSTTSTGGAGGSSTIQGAGGGLQIDAGHIDPDAYFANDPPPMTCDGGSVMPPMVGGTVDCPSDKNRAGCPCTTVGQKAACWPGTRKDRHHGVCQDGMTECKANGEGDTGFWGECVGFVLPSPGVTTGPGSCKCFSGGQWKLDNLSPCFVSSNNSVVGATSTYVMGNQILCPPATNPPKAPTQSWSNDTLTVDCAGHFKLCYTLKAGDSTMPKDSDCVVSSVCVEGDYATENVEQPFPPVPGWVTTTPAQVACAAMFDASGGYGEMSVEGLSVECDTVESHVFNRVQYCSSMCNMNPSAAGCMNCMAGGSGHF